MDLSESIEKHRKKIKFIIEKMEELQSDGVKLANEIENINNFVDDEDNSPTSVAHPVFAEKQKEKLQRDYNYLGENYEKLNNLRLKLMNDLENDLEKTSKMKGGKSKNKRRQKKHILKKRKTNKRKY